MRANIQKTKSRGFTLVEVMLVIMFISILAGMSVLVMGSSSNNANAAAIMNNLDVAKSALLAYSMEHRTRNSDALSQFIGADVGNIKKSLDKYMDPTVLQGGENSDLFNKISIVSNADFAGKLTVGFISFPVDSGLRSALEKKVRGPTGKDPSSLYFGKQDGSTMYSLWEEIK
jgi:prepilin-type N-terminal cleavage/methylation domain-containing protein